MLWKKVDFDRGIVATRPTCSQPAQYSCSRALQLLRRIMVTFCGVVAFCEYYHQYSEQRSSSFHRRGSSIQTLHDPRLYIGLSAAVIRREDGSF
jgi:hypothetical protein